VSTRVRSLADVRYPATRQEVRRADSVKRAMTEDKCPGFFNSPQSERMALRPPSCCDPRSHNWPSDSTASKSLSSKGVHVAVTALETEQCVMQTYTIIGDLVRLTDGDAASVADVS
jgi:hypothetical protein